MLFDPYVLLSEPIRVIEVIAIIIFGKSLAAFALVLLFRYPLNTALTVSASLGQFGEFSFFLANLGFFFGFFPTEAQGLFLVGALFRFGFNRLVFGPLRPDKH